MPRMKNQAALEAAILAEWQAAKEAGRPTSVTDLARKHNVSRNFVGNLVNGKRPEAPAAAKGDTVKLEEPAPDAVPEPDGDGASEPDGDGLDGYRPGDKHTWRL